MRFLLILYFSLFLVQLSLSEQSIHSQWLSFKSDFSKNYKSDHEEFQRYNIFKDNLRKIMDHNKKYDNGHSPYFQGMNKFGDRTFNEYCLQVLLEGNYSNSFRDYEKKNEKIEIFNNNRPLETTYVIDWTEKGGVTEVQDQGRCGSCYAFSAIGALESANWKATGKLVQLSVQNIIDCSRDNNYGCEGGLSDNVFKYIKDNNGVDTEESYPYEAAEGVCRFKSETVGAKVVNMERIKRGDEDAMKSALENSGPLAASIDAGFPSIQFYAGGVFYEPKCNQEYEINHSILIVGYGTQNGVDFWKIKNSMGKKWGDEGYILWARNKNNHCGIATDVFSVTAADGTIIFNQKFIMFNIFLLTSINLMKFMF